MREDSGFSLVEEIRKIDKALPVIALTFAGQRIRPELCKNVLVKPVRQSDLFNTLKAALDEKFRVDHEETSATGSPQADLRILIAEDNESNQKVIVSMLKRLGYQADVVSNGKEVLQALEHAHYDLLLMDVKMPEMDGLEATRIIRRRLHNEIKIIAITAYALKGDREKCLEAGMDDYISKPVSMEELKRMLKWHQFI
jgi:CheY-like chemotaxis protein